MFVSTADVSGESPQSYTRPIKRTLAFDDARFASIYQIAASAKWQGDNSSRTISRTLTATERTHA